MFSFSASACSCIKRMFRGFFREITTTIKTFPLRFSPSPIFIRKSLIFSRFVSGFHFCWTVWLHQEGHSLQRPVLFFNLHSTSSQRARNTSAFRLTNAMPSHLMKTAVVALLFCTCAFMFMFLYFHILVSITRLVNNFSMILTCLRLRWH